MSPATMDFDSGLDFIGGREFWAALARALNFFAASAWTKIGAMTPSVTFNAV
jgi:hypothetical protein